MHIATSMQPCLCHSPLVSVVGRDLAVYMLHLFGRRLLAVGMLSGLLFSALGAAPKDLDSITLPPQPTREDVRVYLKDLEKSLRASSNSGLARDRKTILEVQGKLGKIPVEFLDVALEQAVKLEGDFVMLTYAQGIITIINARVDLPDTLRQPVLDAFGSNPRLATTITRQGWWHGAEAKLIRQCRKIDQGPFLALVELLLAINTPEAIKAIPDILRKATAVEIAQSWKFIARENPPGIDQAQLATSLWKRIKDEPLNSMAESPAHFAPYAARQGVIDALIMVAKKLNGLPNPVEDSGIFAKVRSECGAALAAVLPDTIEPESARVQFVLDNRDRLEFDRATGKYRLRQPAAPH